MLSRLLAIVALLFLNGYFVAVEFALVRSRRTRLEAMTRAGDGKARLALKAQGNLGRMLSASQLGITLASLGLGWVAEGTLGRVLEEWFADLPLALALSARVRSLLYDVSPYDPVTIAAVVALLAIVALAAGFIPARRATRVDPMQVLRNS